MTEQLANISATVDGFQEWGLPNVYDSEFEYLESAIEEIVAHLKLANVSMDGDSGVYNYRSVFKLYVNILLTNDKKRDLLMYCYAYSDIARNLTLTSAVLDDIATSVTSTGDRIALAYGKIDAIQLLSNRLHVLSKQLQDNATFSMESNAEGTKNNNQIINTNHFQPIRNDHLYNQ